MCTGKRWFHIFQKAVLTFLCLAFLWIMAGSVWKLAKAAHLSLFGEAYEGFSFFLGLFLSALLILAIRAGFLWIGKYNSPKVQRLITLGLFLAMSLCYCVLLSTFHANLRNDCYQEVDTAAWLVDHTSVPVDNKHPGELLPFGNNYFFILATSSVIRVLYSMGISDVVPCLQAINAEAMLLGVLFTWLLVRDSFDIKAANRVLLLCALNPLFYGFTFWYYSNSISIPIMMAIPWVALKGYRALRQPIPRTVRMLFWGAVMGLLVFLGYEIRPTAIFPFIALCVIALFPVGGAGWDALREFISDRRKAKAKGVPEESTPS